MLLKNTSFNLCHTSRDPTLNKHIACESTDSRLFDVQADDDERGLSTNVTLFLDGIFDSSSLNSWKQTL